MRYRDTLQNTETIGVSLLARAICVARHNHENQPQVGNITRELMRVHGWSLDHHISSEVALALLDSETPGVVGRPSLGEKPSKKIQFVLSGEEIEVLQALAEEGEKLNNTARRLLREKMNEC